MAGCRIDKTTGFPAVRATDPRNSDALRNTTARLCVRPKKMQARAMWNRYANGATVSVGPIM